MAIKIYADGAKLADMLAAYRAGVVKGFTTNPTLMKQADIQDYEGFAKEVLGHITDLPISFEVFADDLSEMERQARKIAAWGPNVYVKIPVTNTRGTSCAPLIRTLSAAGVSLNVTAILDLGQVEEVVEALAVGTPAVVSVFAGRVADTGRDPVPLMVKALQICKARPKVELLWASPREVLNIYQAETIGCHIITVTPDLLRKLTLRDKSLLEYSLETVKMFFDDGQRAGFRL